MNSAVDEDDPAQKVYKGNIYGRREGLVDLTLDEAMHQTLSAKSGYLKLFIKANVDRTSVVPSLMRVLSLYLVHKYLDGLF